MREFRGGLDRLTTGPGVVVGIKVVEERAVRESRLDVLVIEWPELSRRRQDADCGNDPGYHRRD
jgi:hypothetical protein